VFFILEGKIQRSVDSSIIKNGKTGGFENMYGEWFFFRQGYVRLFC
jgi:hypothetical protein